MKAFIFPGFDSLDCLDNRINSLQIPFVRSRLLDAERVLKERKLPSAVFAEFIAQENSVLQENYDLLIVCSFAIQVGIYEHLLANDIEPDVLVGCSLGDLARTVCAGAISFDDMVEHAFHFGACLKKNRNGAVLRCTASQALDRESIERSLPDNLFLSVYQTPSRFLLSGSKRDLFAWSQSRLAKNLKTSWMIDLPLHSPLMQPTLESMWPALSSTNFDSPKVPIFSAVNGNKIDSGKLFADEFKDNIRGCIDWVAAMDKLKSNTKVSELISIGPAATLIKFCSSIPASAELKMTDGFAISLARI